MQYTIVRDGDGYRVVSRDGGHEYLSSWFETLPMAERHLKRLEARAAKTAPSK